ncbi:Low molecular weight phosphotyrosine protein phosphatase, partial [Candidatus Electrothrix aarhusensis]
MADSTDSTNLTRELTKKISVLFVCIHNSARSQMAEAFLREFGGEYFSVESVPPGAAETKPISNTSG